MTKDELKVFLDKKVDEYDQPFLIKDDPISIPHLFTKKQAIEIGGFFAAIFSWGNRTTIINKSRSLLQLMDNAPYDFCMNANSKQVKQLIGFKNRTFNDTDLLYFVEFFKHHYTKHDSLEIAFSKWMNKKDPTIENALNGFYDYFFSLESIPERTKKHIAAPDKKSTCKRINMYLRWMVRHDKTGVDFGIWKNISPSQLIIPIDVHVAKIARRHNLLLRDQIDWQA